MKGIIMRFLRSMFQIGMIGTLALGSALYGQTAAQAPSAPAAKPKPISYLEPTKDNYLKLAGETEAALRRDVLDVWFPRCIDKENGGFYSDFTRDWKPARSGGKFSVFQGRMTWIAA